jgi:MoxR-like ATPase
MELEHLEQVLQEARTEVAKVIIGQDEVVEHSLIAIFTGNHVLIEGVPGVAKTLLVRTLARTLNSAFSRIQFTPDLMPSDITGTNVFSLKFNDFHLIKGPVFSSFVLADEINRAPAKTQAALLQAMQERTVTIDNETHVLPDDFTVFATQNPIEFEGTYPLPEAQKDRFMLKVKMECPNREDELLLAARSLGELPPEASLDAVTPVLKEHSIALCRNVLSGLTVSSEIIAYAVDLVRSTRSDDSILAGAGPRATQALLLAARARAAIHGHDYVTPDDIQTLAVGVLGHRLQIRPEFELEGLTVEDVIRQVTERVAVPR